MIAWTKNPNWAKPIKRELCGRVSDRYIPCAHEKPCPVHDAKVPRLSVYDPWKESV